MRIRVVIEALLNAEAALGPAVLCGGRPSVVIGIQQLLSLVTEMLTA